MYPVKATTAYSIFGGLNALSIHSIFLFVSISSMVANFCPLRMDLIFKTFILKKSQTYIGIFQR